MYSPYFPLTLFELSRSRGGRYAYVTFAAVPSTR